MRENQTFPFALDALGGAYRFTLGEVKHDDWWDESSSPREGSALLQEIRLEGNSAAGSLTCISPDMGRAAKDKVFLPTCIMARANLPRHASGASMPSLLPLSCTQDSSSFHSQSGKLFPFHLMSPRVVSTSAVIIPPRVLDIAKVVGSDGVEKGARIGKDGRQVGARCLIPLPGWIGWPEEDCRIQASGYSAFLRTRQEEEEGGHRFLIPIRGELAAGLRMNQDARSRSSLSLVGAEPTVSGHPGLCSPYFFSCSGSISPQTIESIKTSDRQQATVDRSSSCLNAAALQPGCVTSSWPFWAAQKVRWGCGSSAAEISQPGHPQPRRPGGGSRDGKCGTQTHLSIPVTRR